MKSAGLLALPSQLVFPASPKQIEQTMADLPVPFGPIITFKLLPVRNSTDSYVLPKKKKYFQSTNFI